MDDELTVRDALVAGVLAIATVLYWTSLPHSLGPADESVHLYEAKRLLEGEVLYRDFFNFITPGWFYLMAALFWLFGTSIETARAAMAVVHGATVVLIYLSGRRLRIRWQLATLPALAYLIWCQSAWPVASQHWLSTVLCAALLCACVQQRDERRASTLAIAVALGLLIGVQQQRGAFMALAVVVWLLADAGLRRWYGARVLVVRPVAVVTGATALVVAGILAVAVLHAGFAAVWHALVIFPLYNYRSEMSCPWGDVNLLTAWNARFTSVAALKYAPVVLALSAVRLAWLASQRRALGSAQGLLLLIVFGAASAASIAYFPDFIKISFIAFAFYVAAAEHLEWLARRLPSRLAHVGVWLLLIAALASSARHLDSNRNELRAAYPISHATAFGRVDYQHADEVRLRDELATLLAAQPNRALYGYPILADLYLTVPADNPTRYGFFLAWGYHSPEQVESVIDVLRARQLPYIVALRGFEPPDDPVLRFINEDYEPMTKPMAGRVIYRLKTSGLQ